MADVSVKMGVSGISQFKSQINQAQASVKTWDSALKLAEKQLQATGDAETYLQNKTTALQSKLAAQKNVVASAEAALVSMQKNGVDQLSKSYQDMQNRLIQAQAAVLDTEMDIQGLGTETQEAAGSTDKLASSLGGLNKKVSLDQVISGINTITGSMEKAAGKALELGRAIWDNVMSSAQWADDSATMALMYGIDLDTFLRVQQLVQNGMDTSVDAILGSQSKLNKNVGNGSAEFMQTMRELGLVVTQYGGKVADGVDQMVTDDSVDLFWAAGKAIMGLTDEYEKEAKAQQLFGKGWKELVPLFTQFGSRSEFEEALAGVNVNSEDTVNNLATLNDSMGELQGNFNTLKNEVIGQLAPALTGAAEALSGLLGNVMDYLQTEEGQEALQNLQTAVSGLFADLGNIDPASVVSGFTEVFNKVVGGVQWLVENKDGVTEALKAIVIGWGALKLTGGALEIMKLISGLTGLTGGGAAAATAAGTATGSAWGAAFGAAVLKAVPWLAAAAVLLTPSNGDAQQDTFLNPDGTLTAAGQQALAEGRLTEDGGGTYHNFFTGEDLTPEVYEMTRGTVRSRMRKIVGEAIVPEDPAEVPVVPEAPEDAAEQISAQIGTVPVAINLEMPHGFGGLRIGEPMMMEHANGLNFVPFDGYPAILHRGERVMPAREVASRSFSSNLYVESMVMNGGADADGLAQAIAARNQRVMAGFGS